MRPRVEKNYVIAIPNIKPLRLWWGAYTLAGYQSLNFRIVPNSKEFHPEVLEAIEHMKQGGHGRKMKKMLILM